MAYKLTLIARVQVSLHDTVGFQESPLLGLSPPLFPNLYILHPLISSPSLP